MKVTVWVAGALFALTGSMSGCALGPADTAQGEPEAVGDTTDPLLRWTAQTSRWSYRGAMPELLSPRLTVSLAGHTVRVTGFLPTNLTRPLPFHAVTELDPNRSGRTLVHVVYPIATVDPGGFTESNLPTRNPEPNNYEVCGGDNYHASNEVGAFGGFPFIEYVCNHEDWDGRVRGGIAFHGPITIDAFEGSPFWYLERGPVSHACNRMLGEHVLEMAHLIGFDRGVRGTPVDVVAGFDWWHGRKVDVDYPATGWQRPSASSSFVFPIWQAVSQRADGSLMTEFPRWACETSRCASMPANGGDEETGGRPLGQIACPPQYHQERVGARGLICISDDGVNAWGPYTKGMVAACYANGGGSVCGSDRWAARFATELRGTGTCPIGARYDVVTGYCAEGDSAFGPFPSTLVARCLAAGGGEVACRSARWNRFFLASLQGRL